MTPVTDTLLQDLIRDAVTGATAAGANVFTPRTWRTPPAAMPFLMIQSPSETKQNVAGRTGPGEFWTVGRFRIVGRVYAKADVADPTGAAIAAEAAVSVLKRQIEVAVINADPIRRAIQQCVSVESVTDVKSDGGLTFGEVEMTFSLEYYQGPEDFAPVASDPFEEFAIYADLINVYSPTGTFDPSLEPFTAATLAPRTSGPDGRPEAVAIVELPQP